MALGTGQLSLGDIAGEFGGSAPHALSEYYDKGNAPSSGEINISDFHGTSASYSITYLIVGGGGAGGANVGQGGGGGASKTASFSATPGTAYTATVGGGGAAAGGYNQQGGNGVASSLAGSGFTTVSSTFGTGGITVADGVINSGQYPNTAGSPGGGRGGDTPTAIGQTNNTVGANGTANSITGSSITYGSGGGGGGWDTAAKAGGTNHTGSNSGGGGTGATGSNRAGEVGQAGVVILKILTADYSGTTTGSPTVSTSGSYKIVKFTGSGTYTA
tara:strand:- start:934 stop:1755 length:822 start_codon:yes stop_codon:yes gene_type:complete